MRLQLTLPSLAASLAAMLLLASSAPAFADDRSEVSTSLFVEKRDSNGKGGLVVFHPQASFGFDIGRYVTMDFAYAADVVSGATATIYQVDAVSTATTFSDVRNEGTFSFGFQGKRSRIVFSGTFGTERDYLTRQVSGSASIDLPGRNTTVGLAYSRSPGAARARRTSPRRRSDLGQVIDLRRLTDTPDIAEFTQDWTS